MKTAMHTMAAATVICAGEEHIAAISRLAGVIWRECYPDIISPAQIDYMLARMYAADVLRAEMRGGIRYHCLMLEGGLGGFAACGPLAEPAVFKLHKLYLLPTWHGRGFGSLLLLHCERDSRERGARRLVLNVNKKNTKAIRAYERNGFAVWESVVADIGGGFVMDDYVMSKDLAPVTDAGR